MQDKWTHGQATKERQIIDAMIAQAVERERQAMDLRQEIASKEARLAEMKPEGWGE